MAGRTLTVACKICLTGLRIACQDVLHVEDVGPSQRVVDALPQEVHQINNLRVGQPVPRLSPLHRMSLLEERTKQAAVAIVQYHDRADEAGRRVGASS